MKRLPGVLRVPSHAELRKTFGIRRDDDSLEARHQRLEEKIAAQARNNEMSERFLAAIADIRARLRTRRRARDAKRRTDDDPQPEGPPELHLRSQ